MHPSIIDMTLRLPVDCALLDSSARASCRGSTGTRGFRGFHHVLADQGRAIGILRYEQPEDLDYIARPVGT